MLPETLRPADRRLVQIPILATIVMQPLQFQPILKQRRWGGARLEGLLNKLPVNSGPWGESWEISDQSGDQSTVSNGDLAGATLTELVQEKPTELLGLQAGCKRFPLLVKLLDIHDWLSLQVHPTDSQAAVYGPDETGKTESWVVLRAEPGSRVYAGLQDGVTREAFQTALNAGAVEETLHAIEVQAGDCIHIPAGTVHAIGPEIILAEVQQQSDLTFRLHDWGRLGTDGRPRELHVRDAMDCISFDAGPVSSSQPIVQRCGGHHLEELVRCEHYEILRHESATDFSIHTQDRFRVLMVVDGNASLRGAFEPIAMALGTTVLVPASVPVVDVCPLETATVLEIAVPLTDA